MHKKIISVINQKGGVGKSTVSVNLAYELSRKGKRVLLIDLDPQAHSSCIYCNNITHEMSIARSFTDKDCELTDLIQEAKLNQQSEATVVPNLFVIPATIRLALNVEQITSRIYREKILLSKIDKIKDQFEYIILDCPPTLGLLAINAIYAAETIIAPTDYGRYSLDGMGDLINSIREVKDGQTFDFFILRNMYDRRNSQTNKYIQGQLDEYEGHLLATVIRKNESVNQSQINGVPISVFDMTCNGAHDFLQLSEEILLNAA